MKWKLTDITTIIVYGCLLTLLIAVTSVFVAMCAKYIITLF